MSLPRLHNFAALLVLLVMAAGGPAAAAVSTSPLVADAGATPAVTDGRLSLMGAGWGGEAPYHFHWTIDGAENFSANRYAVALKVGDWAPGSYTARLMVTDQAGATASDELRFVIPGANAAPPPALSVDAGGTYEFVTGTAQRLEGRIEGGTPPYQAGWDFDRDGRIDADGARVLADLGTGHHLVRLLITDAEGMRAQQMTSVYVGSREEIRDLAVPLTIIGMSDSGINPYHSEFSADTYPDPRVLELTQNFTRHPCEYLEQYPCNSRAVPITLGEGYYPEQDQELWAVESPGELPFVQPGLLHWIPGTKIIGAFSTGGFDAPPSDLILDNNGHGTGSAGVAVGNRYGYCPTCLIYIVDGLQDDVVYGFDFAEITTHSHGYVASAPIGLLFLNDPLGLLPRPEAKAAAERGVTVLFSSGNGVGNAFTVTNETYGSDQTGPAWTINVGALRRDTSGSIVGDGTPAYVSSWGDGWIPSACRTGTDSVCAHSGTSAASPLTAGVFGTVLRGVRDALGDHRSGVRPGQVLAEGRPIPDSRFLDDGVLTRRELRGVVLKTTASLDAQFSPFPYPANVNADDRFLFEGYGATTPNAAARALEVLLGRAELPDRSDADMFFAQDCEIRDGLYGGYDRNGDGNEDSCAEDIANLEKFAGSAAVTNERPFVPFAGDEPRVPRAALLSEALEYELHRTVSIEPYREPASCGLPQTATEEDHQEFMSRRPEVPGDQEPCFDSRITSTVAGFRPKGIFAADDELAGVLPAGSTVEATLYVQTAGAGPSQLEALLTATDRVIGRSEPVVNITSPAGWTEYNFMFSTDRMAVTGERLGVHFTLTGQTEWAYGFEGDHASRVTITPASGEAPPFGVTVDNVDSVADGLRVAGQVLMPDLGPDTELGNAGFAPVDVQVQVASGGDFNNAVWARVDARSARYEAVLPAAGDGSVQARAFRHGVPSAPAAFTGASAPRTSPVDGVRGGALGGALWLLVGCLWLGRRRRA